MKKILFILFLFSLNQGFAQKINYNAQNISLLGTWDDPGILPNGSFVDNRYSSCWGYAQKGREYAILGAQTGTIIVDITNPAVPKKVAFIKGRREKCVWREYKTYKNYLYCISDDGSPNSFQIADMSYLPDSVHIVHDDNTIFERGHASFIDKDKLYISSTKFGNGTYSPMAIFDLTKPEKPVLYRSLSDDFPNAPTAHDMFVQNDTCYMSGGNAGLFVYKLGKDKKFTQLGALSKYPSSGYNHTTMILPNHNYMIMTDEVPNGLPAKVIDISNLTDIKTVTTFSSGTKATPHNIFPAPNNRIALSYYEDGFQVFDLKNPAKPVRTGFFDTHYQTDSTNTTGGYVGLWSAYTELPSKNVIGCDMQNGLFILDAKKAYGIKTDVKDIENQTFASISPNPFTDNVIVKSKENANFDLVVFDALGKIIFQAKNKNIEQFNIPTSDFAKGIYMLQITNGKITQTEKLVKN
jgi:choice-of-anchor B domain-containing protein